MYADEGQAGKEVLDAGGIVLDAGGVVLVAEDFEDEAEVDGQIGFDQTHSTSYHGHTQPLLLDTKVRLLRDPVVGAATAALAGGGAKVVTREAV